MNPGKESKIWVDLKGQDFWQQLSLDLIFGLEDEDEVEEYCKLYYNSNNDPIIVSVVVGDGEKIKLRATTEKGERFDSMERLVSAVDFDEDTRDELLQLEKDVEKW